MTSFKALCQIESMCGKTIIQLVRAFADGTPGVKDIATIAYCLHLASNPEPKTAPSLDELGEMICTENVFAVSPQVFEVLLHVLNKGSADAKKNSAQPTP
jgi:hypothetical protein